VQANRRGETMYTRIDSSSKRIHFEKSPAISTANCGNKPKHTSCHDLSCFVTIGSVCKNLHVGGVFFLEFLP